MLVCVYLCVLLVSAVDLGYALARALGGGRGREGLLHPTCSISQFPLDAEGLVQLIHLYTHTHTHKQGKKMNYQNIFNILVTLK